MDVSEIQRVVVAAFENVLGVDSVQADDNYFALGGDSLSAIQLLSELSGSFGCTPNIIVVLEEPTPKAIALHISSIVASR